jgi:signal transduction histidine kinase/CheY-like chemotaxis protein
VEGEGFRLGKRFETTALTREGRELPIEVAVTQFQASSRSLLTIFIRDVSERKAAEESLTRTQEQLRHSQKLEAVGRLAGGVAHDFNNMLTVINGYAESLYRGISKDNRWLGPVTQILQAGKRASLLTRQLLAFSRKQVLQPKIFNLNDVLRDMTKLLSRVIGEDIELSTVLASDASHIKADPGQMEQVIMNLAVNARDAMPHGGKLILETMNVELDENYTRKRDEVKPGRYVMLAVTDTGCGMTESVKARVFEPFFTTKEVGKGTGLGLAMVYGIIKQSGGHIAVYSEPDRGTTFKIYLPCGGEKAELPVFAATERQPVHQAATGTVLLVEDEDMVRELTKDVLQSNGYTVLEARHGVEALELYKDRIHSIDLTLTDVVMPQMNGRAFASNLLSIRPDMKILYMSGYTDNAITRTGILENGSAFLQKPFTADSLISKLRDLVNLPTSSDMGLCVGDGLTC